MKIVLYVVGGVAGSVLLAVVLVVALCIGSIMALGTSANATFYRVNRPAGPGKPVNVGAAPAATDHATRIGSAFVEGPPAPAPNPTPPPEPPTRPPGSKYGRAKVIVDSKGHRWLLLDDGTYLRWDYPGQRTMRGERPE